MNIARIEAGNGDNISLQTMTFSKSEPEMYPELTEMDDLYRKDEIRYNKVKKYNINIIIVY